LLEAGIVDQFTLQRALGEEENSKTIDEVLLDTGVIGDVSIAKALSRQLTIPLIGLKNVDIPQQVVSLVPVEVAKKHLLVPVEESEGTLLVAMADPLDEEAIRVVRVAAQMKIEVAVSSRQEVLEVLERIYPMEYLNQIFADNPDSDDVTVDL
jgi:type IV pilus assembly protein PilB